ncbi:MAG TPA: helix-turn-helix domain-containing protein [Burkholderiaceae bacterium]|nr:helix-turn-helix domain-containing protein [Burkholderiaceae bacterium]
MQTHTIAVLAFDGISPFHLSVPCNVFGADCNEGGQRRIALQVCAWHRGPLRTSAGFDIQVRHGLAALARADTVIVPSWTSVDDAPPPALLRALRAAHARGARVVGLCLGAFVLAAAGLLDDRPATTHWQGANELARRYPRVRVQPDVLYVDDGDVLTSAGTAAGIDCCLHLLRALCGSAVASHVARCMVVPPHRQGGQAQYVERPMADAAGGERFLALLDWLGRHLHRQHDLDTLAARALMSRRSFTRRFRQVTGTTVVQWLLAQRLALARQLLETSDHPVERVAQLAGFGSALSLRQHFGKALGTTPSRYRREFGGR